MPKKRLTQCDVLLSYLQQGNSISGIEALHKFGIYRLADVVFKLRKQGHNIITSIQTAENAYTHAPCEYAAYSLAREGESHEESA